MNQTRPNQYNGFIALDGLISLLSVILIIFLLTKTISILSSTDATNARHQKIMNKIIAIADNVVKNSAAIHINDVKYPNWIDEQKLNKNLTENLREKTDLSKLYLGTNPPSETYPICIYRIVVTGDEKEIKQLFVCGG
ncbi:MAG: hypothetical protein ABH842_02535 [Candidatus Micrarchaeota archaeon]